MENLYTEEYQHKDTKFDSFAKTRLNLIKIIYESLGIDYGPTENKMNYINYLIENPISLGNAGGENFEFDAGSPIISSGQIKANAMMVISMLMRDLGLTKAQGAGVAGVLTAESNINPHIVNSGEKKGTYKASGANNLGTPYGTKHSPWSYGAGICQWTFCDRKERAIMGGLGVTKDKAISIIKGGGIESLSLQQQIQMLEYELKTTYKYTLEGLKKCNSASQAAATFYCHMIAGYSKSTSPATQQEINAKNAAYSKVGAESQINKGMRYAEGYMH